MNNVTNYPEVSDLDRFYIDYMNGVDNESRINHLVNLILNTAHEKDFIMSIDLLMNIMTTDYEDHRSAAQSLLMIIKTVDRYRLYKWQWWCDESKGHVYFSANHPRESEHDAVPLHSESRIQELVHMMLCHDAGKSFTISIEQLVTTMLPHPQEDYLKSYKRAARMFLIRLNDADRERFRDFSFACDEGRSIVYFGIKDKFGSIEIS